MKIFTNHISDKKLTENNKENRREVRHKIHCTSPFKLQVPNRHTGGREGGMSTKECGVSFKGKAMF